MIRPNPIDLADWQLAHDRKATARFSELFERKQKRMSASPLAYLRGAAPLFYRLLAEYPELAKGPRGKGWLCGDAHLENFGVFRTNDRNTRARARSATHTGKEAVVFDVNDFDEAVVGPWRIDVLRMVTSLILGGREIGATGRRSIVLSHLLLENYVQQACGPHRLPQAPSPIALMLKQVQARTHRVLLAGRTEVVAGKLRFLRGDHYTDLPRRWQHSAREAFADYVSRLDTTSARDHFKVIDVAFRIAGTGSLGGLRVAVLTTGKGNRNGAWLFDMKEEGRPSPSLCLREPSIDPARRVLDAVRASLEHPPRMIGTTTLDGLPMFVRRLAPQEDKLSLERLRDEHLESVASYMGALLGRAHRRGAVKPPRAAWTKDDCADIIERAVVMAGLHEGAYLAMCRRHSLGTVASSRTD